MRRVEVSKVIYDAGKEEDEEKKFYGYLLEYGVMFIEIPGGGAGHCTTAIIEKDDGTVEECLVADIRFLKPYHAKESAIQDTANRNPKEICGAVLV